MAKMASKAPVVPRIPESAVYPVILGPKAPPAKGMLQSKTVWGVVVMALARWLGHDIDGATQSAITGDVVVIVGALLAIWGRLSAQKPIDSVV